MMEGQAGQEGVTSRAASRLSDLQCAETSAVYVVAVGCSPCSCILSYTCEPGSTISQLRYGYACYGSNRPCFSSQLSGNICWYLGTVGVQLYIQALGIARRGSHAYADKCATYWPQPVKLLRCNARPHACGAVW